MAKVIAVVCNTDSDWDLFTKMVTLVLDESGGSYQVHSTESKAASSPTSGNILGTGYIRDMVAEVSYMRFNNHWGSIMGAKGLEIDKMVVVSIIDEDVKRFLELCCLGYLR